LYFRRIPLEHTGNTPEDGSSIPPGTFSDFFLLTGIHRKKFRPEYCFHFRGISGAFPRDTVTFPHLSSTIPEDMVAGIFVLGIYSTDVVMEKLSNLNTKLRTRLYQILNELGLQ
jgi:hypothetical protein